MWFCEIITISVGTYVVRWLAGVAPITTLVNIAAPWEMFSDFSFLQQRKNNRIRVIANLCRSSNHYSQDHTLNIGRNMAPRSSQECLCTDQHGFDDFMCCVMNVSNMKCISGYFPAFSISWGNKCFTPKKVTWKSWLGPLFCFEIWYILASTAPFVALTCLWEGPTLYFPIYIDIDIKSGQ